MRVRAALVSLAVLACGAGVPARSVSERIAPRPKVAGDPELAFPGGGRILFYAPDTGGIGFIEADGTFHRLPRSGRLTFPYWDPAAPDRVLTMSNGSRPDARSYEIDADSLRLVGSWRTTELMTWPSPDGRTIAYTPIDRSGHHFRTGVLRLVDRSSHETTAVRSHGLVPEGWTPDGLLLAFPWRGGDLTLWDPWTGTTTPFGSGNVSSIVWSPDGTRFASGESDGALVIGDPDGRVSVRLPLRGGSVSTPTWSPDGGRIAFIVRGGGRMGHRRARLHVYDVRSLTDSVVASPVSDGFWASWSPDGRWLLADDWTRHRWLFVAADGGESIPYPRLGGFPRWCCPSSPPISVQIPVC